MTPNPNPSPECICGKRFTMCEDGHAIDCPASNQFAKWQEMATPAALSQTLPAPGEETCPVCEGKPMPLGSGCMAGCRDGIVLTTSANVLRNMLFWYRMQEREIAELDTAALATVAAANDEGVALDWRAVAKLAGEHGVRYRTNTALEKFLAAIRLLSQGGGKA